PERREGAGVETPGRGKREAQGARSLRKALPAEVVQLEKSTLDCGQARQQCWEERQLLRRRRGLLRGRRRRVRRVRDRDPRGVYRSILGESYAVEDRASYLQP